MTTLGKKERSEILVLWDKAKEGNEKSFEDLYSLMFPVLYSYGRNFSGQNEDVIQDLIQDLFIHIWVKRKKLNHIKDIVIYLFISLKNNLISASTKSRKHPHLNAESLNQPLVYALSSDEEVQTGSQTAERLSTLLMQKIGTLPKRQQEVIFLRYYQRLSFEEVAQVMGINNQSARNFSHKAIKTLRKYIADFENIIFVLLVKIAIVLLS